MNIKLSSRPGNLWGRKIYFKGCVIFSAKTYNIIKCFILVLLFDKQS